MFLEIKFLLTIVKVKEKSTFTHWSHKYTLRYDFKNLFRFYLFEYLNQATPLAKHGEEKAGVEKRLGSTGGQKCRYAVHHVRVEVRNKQLAVVGMLEASRAVVDAGHRVPLLCNKIKIMTS